MKLRLKFLIALGAFAVILLLMLCSGCATEKDKSTTSYGGTNSVIYHHSSKDALSDKIVVHRSVFRGVKFQLFGGGGYAPIDALLGEGQDYWMTIPTSTNVVYAAPYANTANGSFSLFNDAVSESGSTTSNGIPIQAYQQQNVTPVNPIVPVQSTPTVSTNAPGH